MIVDFQSLGFRAKFEIRALVEADVLHPEGEFGLAVSVVERHAVYVLQVGCVYLVERYSDAPHLAFRDRPHDLSRERVRFEPGEVH